ncbi:MAG: ABC transporter substrate-binding protein [Alphaproteobacteria bacterium]|nr:ABC transporter substrate-binding protein [Alphaproteobacteria bacterium]
MTTIRPTRREFVIGAGAVLAAPAVVRAQSEIGEVRIAKQFGISYLPLMIMEDLKLVEKHAAAAGLPNVKTSWLQFAGGAPINDALISGNLEFAGGGVGPMIVLWAKTKGSLNVKGVASLNSLPLYLNTINANVKKLADFSDKDRIGLPAVRVSIQAITLQMACEKEFGVGKHDKLDSLTVSMSHPDAMNAMMSGKSEVTSHFASPPFQNQELLDSRVHRVLSNYDVLGGSCSFNFMWTTEKVRTQNPKVYKAFYDALAEAQAIITKDKARAAEIYMRVEKGSPSKDFVMSLLNDPQHEFTNVPRNTMKYADFMHRTGTIKVLPADWKEMYFPEMHALKGS